MLFNVGRVEIDKEVLIQDDIQVSDLVAAFGRFIQGDWGDLDGHSTVLNDVALASGDQVVAEYRASSGSVFWIIRQASKTTVTLPQAKPSLSTFGTSASYES